MKKLFKSTYGKLALGLPRRFSKLPGRFPRLPRLFSRPPAKQAISAALFVALAFGSGRLAAWAVDVRQQNRAVTVSADGNWGLSFPNEGQMPVGNASADYLKQYNAYYGPDTREKVIYLTFDAG